MELFNDKGAEPWQIALADKHKDIFRALSPVISRFYSDDQVAAFVAAPGFWSLRYGFEFSNASWQPLVEELAQFAEELGALASACGAESPYVRPVIIKEKMGALRWQGSCQLPRELTLLWDNYCSNVELRSSGSPADGTFGPDEWQFLKEWAKNPEPGNTRLYSGRGGFEACSFIQRARSNAR